MLESFVQVLLPLALDQSFTYLTEEVIERGDVVLVEFGRKKIWGAVISVDLKPPESLKLEKIKKILERNSRLKLSKNQLEFIFTIASYNLANRGLVLRSMLGILNSDKVKKPPVPTIQEIKKEKFFLKKLLPKQQKTADNLWLLIEQNQSPVVLLEGVTGSGKTEIYFAIVAKILSQKTDAQILILLPEIALTSQLLMRFVEQFGFTPALWHSKISKKDKREIFYGIVAGSVRVLIGARSSLLLPFKNLQLIIVDEENDSSFKQEEVFNFHARDMAIAKAKLENTAVILSSATPSIETYSNAISGKYHHFLLEQKFGQQNYVELVDLSQERLPSGEFLSSKLRREIAQSLSIKKQVLLFLNRRGYAPTLLCKSCGKIYQCQNCDFNLVLHKTKNKLTCHHCGHEEKPLLECKFCGEKDSLISIGVGVEKIEEEVRNLFPEARIALVTSDVINNFSDAKILVEKILNHEIEIIIGTQMIAKGYDFPDLRLVGIVDADSMLYSSELRAIEKTFQVITQVMGRAGRRDSTGKIIIQTHNPQNLLFEKILKSSPKDFYQFEINNRRTLQMPPFSRLARFEISSFVETEAKNFAKKLIQNFPIDEKIELFGPAPAVIQRLKNRHHFLVNLKVEKKVNLQKLILDVVQRFDVPKSVRMKIDIDPL